MIEEDSVYIEEELEDVPMELKHGPTKSRNCTDPCWVILFIAFNFVFLSIGNYSLKHGDAKKLTTPYFYIMSDGLIICTCSYEKLGLNSF